MGTYPWGPHGPQSGPNEVTPNPTPAYVPPPMPTWDAPAPSYNAPTYGGGGQPAYSGGYSGPVGPHKKSYILATILAAIFGPLGLLYASKKGAFIVLLFLIGYPVSMAFLAHARGAYAPSNPFTILSSESAMSLVWTYAVYLSVIWAVVAVLRYNMASKAAYKAQQSAT